MIYLDLSYIIFFRYFATYSWYSKQITKSNFIGDEKKEEPKPVPTKDSIFIEKYNKLFEKMLLDLQKTHKLSEFIIAIDCSRDQIWRTSIYPEYKAGRETSSTFDSEIFSHTINILLPELSKTYNLKLYYHPHLEADDIVAIFVRKADISEKKVIITGDYDYKQLLNIKNLSIYNLKGQEFIVEDTKLFLETKIIMGDKSDNIPAIAKKVGPVTALKLAKDPEALDMFFLKYPGSNTQYLLNQKLISFDYIPKNYASEIKLV